MKFYTTVVVLAMCASVGKADFPSVPKPDPQKPVDYLKWLNDTLSANITHNAADLYRQIDESILTRTTVGDYELDQKALAGPWSGPEFKPIEEWLMANQKNMDLVRRAVLIPDCYFRRRSDPQNLHVCDSVNSAQTRALAKMLLIAGWGEVGRKNPKGLIDNAMTVLRLAHHNEQGPFLIDRLIGIACSSLAYDALIQVLNEIDDPSSCAAGAIGSLAESDAPMSTLVSTLPYERVYLFYLMQRISEWDNQSGKPRFSEAKANSWSQLFVQKYGDHPDVPDELGFANPMANIDGWGRVDFLATVTLAEDFDQSLALWLDQPYHLAQNQLEQINRKWVATKNPILENLGASPANYGRIRSLCERAVSKRHGVRLIYAIWAHHKETGSFPSSIARLRVPGDANIRIDSFSGKNLIYKQTGDGFRLYSVGTDQDDDGGKHHSRWGDVEFGKTGKPDGDFVFWPPQLKEF